MRERPTPEATLARWMADPRRRTVSYSTLVGLGWEAGQAPYIEAHGMRYERFDLDDGFCVVEWDAEGESIVVA